ncbi:pilus assembly protein PilP [Oleispira antarctica]|jgi:type IV pilus assembly protein PilO|uniref:Pilus assembly protein PilP n=1 Tax=Oleispira antarctica TaxID=188908 RepID=A0A1Y5HLZ5_OLEAN|nr:pilus assembly protein PilP [Oleispira antarctica]
MAKDSKFDLQPYLDKINEFDVNDIDWENMGSWPLVGKAVFCTVIAVALLVGGYFMLLEPMQLKLSREVKQESQLKKDFENKAFQVANLEEYRAQMVEMELSFESILKQLPRDTEVPGLIDDISLAALNNGLDLKVISPQKQISTEFYNELPIEIEVEGDYHELGAYVSSVASLPRIVTLHDFSISTKGKNSDLLSLKILAKTYRYNEGD